MITYFLNTAKKGTYAFIYVLGVYIFLLKHNIIYIHMIHKSIL